MIRRDAFIAAVRNLCHGFMILLDLCFVAMATAFGKNCRMNFESPSGREAN